METTPSTVTQASITTDFITLDSGMVVFIIQHTSFGVFIRGFTMAAFTRDFTTEDFIEGFLTTGFTQGSITAGFIRDFIQDFTADRGPTAARIPAKQSQRSALVSGNVDLTWS